jgi:methylenetetrahydrofolate reductase (NADPH)
LVLSFELFPPKTEEGLKHLVEHVDELVTFRPAYITCTYGAGGSTRNKTLETLRIVQERYGIPVASHLTCVGATTDDLRAYLRQAREQGIDYIVAIRGDAPRGQASFELAPGGLCYASELVGLIREEFPEFGIIVGGYPETHPEAASPETDIENLKRKVDAGADVIVTQLFFDNQDFFRWRDRCVAAGISVPIIPGILPVTSLPQVQKIVSLCGARIAKPLLERLEAHGDDLVGQFAVGVYYATRQVEELVSEGVPGVHFYVLNKSHATALICRSLILPHRQAYQKQ